MTFGLALLLLFVPASVGALAVVWQGDWSFSTVLAFKIVYGVLVGWVATPLVVLAALRERS
jgi:putative effector of murein hydrolase LrgA (UPF0299 family)